MSRLTFLLVFFLLAAACRERTPPATTVSPEEAQHAAFKALNTQLVLIDDYLSRLKNPDLKKNAQASAEALKKRRDALRTRFSLQAYEELQLDVTLDARRLSAWLEEETRAASATVPEK